MTERLRWFIKTNDGDTTTFKFNNNRNITSVKVLLNEGYKTYVGEEVTVKYALNGVITDLICFGTAKIGNNDFVEIVSDTPLAASHVFVTVKGTKLLVKEIELYEELREEATNYYPAYFDTVLNENYYLDTVSVFTSREGYSNYKVYTSLDGTNFDFLAEKENVLPCDFSTGDIYDANGREARIIRVYIEYNSSYVEALLEKVTYTGKPSKTSVIYPKEIKIEDFKDSKYNIEITNTDTYEEVYSIIERRLGKKYTDWFKFEISENPNKNSYDYFAIDNHNGKIKISGNNGVSLCVGLNHYLKYYCKVNISQVGDQTKMPDRIVLLDKEIHRETKAKVRYAYNYCTLSYTMAFWGEKEWENELDWLALNGVNVVLDTTAQEEVWRRFLGQIGYTHNEIKKFIAGPAYYAWFYMANLTGFGGPVHDSWFEKRTLLARKNHLKMRKLGMYPVLQGYSGMVPLDIKKHDKSAEVILQGTWCSFERPTMLRTTSDTFKKYADLFYNAQKEVYGDYSHFFATDPFHEGGNVGNMSPYDISREVLSAMLKNNKDSVWIIQSWQNNPTSELLRGIGSIKNGKQHALILDLYSDKYQNYKNGNAENNAHGYSDEFDKTPFVFCMLNNFGGRLGLHGHIDNLNKFIPETFNNCKCIAGIGITPEASLNNPVLYDFFFEYVWRENADLQMAPIDVYSWVCDYSERRYGKKSSSANSAWEILLDTVYNSKYNIVGQGAAESIVNARPTLESKSASSWGNCIISYDKKELEKALKLLLDDFDKLKDSKGYKYDLITVAEQVLSNKAQDVHLKMANAFNNKNLNEFKKYSDKFLRIADLMNEVLSGDEQYLLGSWVNKAVKLSENTDDFTKMLYTLNAKSLITTWGSFNQCETGGLRDYSNRQWSGLISDFYKVRWEIWINDRINELSGAEYTKKYLWFPFEWEWARSNKKYTDIAANIDLHSSVKRVLSTDLEW